MLLVQASGDLRAGDEVSGTGDPGCRQVDPLAYHHAHWTRHGAPLLDLLGAVIDHVQAFSTGGPDHIDNLATACNKCNGRKSAATLDKWGERPMEKPIKGKYGEPQRWDGFSTLFVVLARRNLDALTTTEKGWLKALS
jgi:5-methylcytosine-specific restriction endonuclease McrA